MSVLSLDRLRTQYAIATRDAPPTHFVTFANTSFLRPTRILAEAAHFPFLSRRALTEHDLGDFGTKHADFIAAHSRGYGLWIWKPKIILDTLVSLNDGDRLVYCDAGMHLNARGIRRYLDYHRILDTADVLTFSLNDAYKAQHYVKRDAINACYPEFASQITPYCYAGVMMLKKTPATLTLIREWLSLCETYRFLDTSPSDAEELPCFLGNDCDNGLFNLCLAKHKISASIYPDETNLYTDQGVQHYMATSTEWARLVDFPFQCRRIRRT
jgi:hypothetical protein